MKKLLFGFVCLFLASQLFVSCSSENEIMSQFSKRKYLKKFKDKNVKHKDEITKHDNSIDYNVASDEMAASDLTPTNFEFSEVEEIDNSEMIVLTDEQSAQLKLLKNATSDYSKWNKYNRESNFSKIDFNSALIENEIHKDNIVKSSQVNNVVLVILCIFIPPLAVYLYEDSITVNFWVDLIGTLLFWIPGMIFAFLVCFAGVSL